MEERTYWSKDIADLLGIGTSTLRKWCLQLEKDGYTFLRDEHDRRAYTEHDVIALRFFQELSKDKGLTLENASIAVVSKFNRVENASVTISAMSPNERSNQRYNELVEKVEELIEYNAKQDAFNQALIERLDKQQQYIEESLKRRDEQLVNAIREVQETKKLLAVTNEEKKKWWRFWK